MIPMYKHSNDLGNYFEFYKLRSKCKHNRHRDYSFYTINSERNKKNNPNFNELLNINLKIVICPDKLSPIFLQKCAFLLTPVITALFNKSLETGQYQNYPLFLNYLSTIIINTLKYRRRDN
ncbi:Uncharacterized protein FWK35_00014159 [Aphis craccivora]|uniref:Uncharacterized protein n=1 Tax=Aphis craccivora TaxID=307492 RepID=A0A6G0Y4X6_APHCR|nr:Uncharacterized protein FWK35_00014159 [Aphis craccivora]